MTFASKIVRFIQLAIPAVAFALVSVTALQADVLLTFDQNGAADGQALRQDYGDNVIASPDSNGHSYDIITGNMFGLTPNVELSYSTTGSGSPSIWLAGYGDLLTVMYGSGATTIQIEMVADPGFEVGVFGFDMASFGGDRTIGGLQLSDDDANVLWSQGSTTISGSTHNDFDFADGLFASSLTLDIDLGGQASNIGIDNLHFVQRAIPEPSGLLLVSILSCLIALPRRGRKRRGLVDVS